MGNSFLYVVIFYILSKRHICNTETHNADKRKSNFDNDKIKLPLPTVSRKIIVTIIKLNNLVNYMSIYRLFVFKKVRIYNLNIYRIKFGPLLSFKLRVGSCCALLIKISVKQQHQHHLGDSEKCISQTQCT